MVLVTKNKAFSSLTDCLKNTRFPGVASGVALGDTFPVPPCFEDKTNAKHGNQDL